MVIEVIIVVLLSIFLAVTMKTADNLNEHGLKLFKGANILFGILFGIFGAILVVQSNLLANIWLAVFIGLTTHATVDRLNHGIAFGIVFSVFLLNLNNFNLISNVYWLFFLAMIISGLTHNCLSSRKDIKKIYSELFHTFFFYIAVPFVFAIFTGLWIAFYSLFSFIVAYELTRFYSNKKIKGVTW